MKTRMRHAATRVLLLIVIILSVIFLSSCGALNGASKNPSGNQGSPASGAAYDPSSTEGNFADLMANSEEPVIDTSHFRQGYVCAAATSPANLKFQVTLGDQTYNYDLPNDGSPEAYPLNMGSGTYSLRIMQNTTENKYVEIAYISVDVELDSDFSPFLVPNMFCWYEPNSACVAKARELTEGATNQAQVVEAVCTYVADNISYDVPKAVELSQGTGYVPSPDETLATCKGICFDYASLSAAMLRSSGIPTKLMTGYVGNDKLYHSWIMVYIDGSWETVSFQVKPNQWSRCDVTFASTGENRYVGDASFYEDRYTY